MPQELHELRERFRLLEERLADPALMKDRQKYAEVAREHQKLGEILRAAGEVANLRQQLEEAKSLAREPDVQILAEEEVERLQREIEQKERVLERLLYPEDPLDHKNVILEIRAGTGGEEAALFAGELFRMYRGFAERKGWVFEPLSVTPTELGGTKEAVVAIRGQGCYGQLKFESGIHRVQRVPVTESSGRIHTSAASVAVLPEAEEVDVTIRPEDIQMDVFRASGAGGQHVNKTSSAVRLTHLPTGIVVSCQDERSQFQNRQKAMRLLRSYLLEAQQKEQKAKLDQERRSQVGSGDRSEKIRTYNFPQDRLTDHRVPITLHNLEKLLAGEVEPLVESLQRWAADRRNATSK